MTLSSMKRLAVLTGLLLAACGQAAGQGGAAADTATGSPSDASQDAGTGGGLDADGGPAAGNDTAATQDAAPLEVGTPAHFAVGGTPANSSLSTSTAIAADGTVFVARPAILTASEGIVVSRFNGEKAGTFTDELVIPTGATKGAGDGLKLRAGKDGTLHLLTRTSSSDNFRLLYAVRAANGTWTSEEVFAGARVGNPALDLALASSGAVHAAFQITNQTASDGSTTAAVVHAQRTGAGTWQTTIVAQSTQAEVSLRTVGRSLAMTLDSSGEPVLAFEGDPVGTATAATYVVSIATRSGGPAGSFDTVNAVAGMHYNPAMPNSLALALAGSELHLVYRRDGDPNQGGLDSGLRSLKRGPAGGWVAGPLAPANPTESMFLYEARAPSIAVDKDQVPWFATGASTLVLVKLSSPFQFAPIKSPVDTFGYSFGAAPSLVFGADGAKWISCRGKAPDAGARTFWLTVVH